jgi:alpha-beta hydrolase superfamily lysophospholipase
MLSRAITGYAGRLLVVVAAVFAAAGEPAAPVTRQAHEVAVDGHPIRVWEKSPSSPTATMVLVHGRTWSTVPDFDLQAPGEKLSLMDGLATHGIASFGVDLRGYGQTPRDDSGWLTPERAAADVVAVLEWLAKRNDDASSYVFGWSYGAMVAQLVAQQRPDLVRGLILFGYPVRPGIDVEPDGAAGSPPRYPTTAEAAASDFIVPGAISDRAIEAFVAAALAADPVRADWRQLEQWQALDGAAVRVPTLLLEAFHDPLALNYVHANLFIRLDTDDKAWIVIPGGGHAAFMETPRRYFLEQLATFIHRGR